MLENFLLKFRKFRFELIYLKRICTDGHSSENELIFSQSSRLVTENLVDLGKVLKHHHVLDLATTEFPISTALFEVDHVPVTLDEPNNE